MTEFIVQRAEVSEQFGCPSDWSYTCSFCFCHSVVFIVQFN